MTTHPSDICGVVAGVDRKIRPDWNWVSPIWTEKRATAVEALARARSFVLPPVFHLLDLGSRQIMSLDSVNCDVSRPVSSELQDWGRAESPKRKREREREGDGRNNHTLPAIVVVADG